MAEIIAERKAEGVFINPGGPVGLRLRVSGAALMLWRKFPIFWI